jgi:hypothetical protein
MKRIKAAVVKHYNANSEALDLSQLHTDAGEGMVMYNKHTHTERLSTLCMLRDALQKQLLI